MVSDPTLGLILAMPGRIRDGWRTLLKASPQIDCVAQADDVPSGLTMTAELRPAVVLLDADLVSDQARTVLRQIKAQWPQAQCIVMISNGEQRWLANANGVDAVLVKGFSTRTLNETIAELLPSIEGVTGGN